MNISRLIQKMRMSGIALQPEGKNLRVRSKLPLTDKQHNYIVRNKAEIIRYLEHMTPSEEKAIRSWCTFIGEQNQELIDEVLARCNKIIDARRYFLKRSEECRSNAG